MVDSLQRLREPAAVLLLVAAVVRFLVAMLALAIPELLGGYPSLWLTARLFVLDPATSAVLAAVVASCVLWRPTPHGRLLAVLALVAVSVAAAVAVIFGVLAVALGAVTDGAWGNLLWILADLAVPLVAIVVLARLQSGQAKAPTGQLASPGTGQLGMTATGDDPQAIGVAPPAELAPREQPTWQPHEAAGAAWYSAQDAAAGAAASGWGTPGEAASWSPVPPGSPQPPTNGSDGRGDPRPESGR